MTDDTNDDKQSTGSTRRDAIENLVGDAKTVDETVDIDGELFSIIPANVLAPKEAIMGFLGFLASVGVSDLNTIGTKTLTDLIEAFSTYNALPEVRENWTDRLTILEIKEDDEDEQSEES